MNDALASAPVPADPLAARILVVDDEAAIRRLLRSGLTRHGYHVLDAATGRQGLEALALAPDLTILDLDLPDLDGFDVLRVLRRCGETLPVIVLTAREAEDDKVRAFELGADDYVVKPFGMSELAARIRTALRHALQAGGERAVFATGDLEVDLVRRVVAVSGAPVELSAKEYQLLRLLVRHAGEAISHAAILERVWNPDTKRNHLRAYVQQLRRKIEPDRSRTALIETIAGVGYRLRAADRGRR